MAETLSEFLARVHEDDVRSGKDYLHKPGVCTTCDAYRAEKEAA